MRHKTEELYLMNNSRLYIVYYYMLDAEELTFKV